MDAVVVRKGQYGGRMRLPGDRVALKKGDELRSWMVTADSAEGRHLTGGNEPTGRTAREIADELAVATGRDANASAVRDLNIRISELEDENVALRAKLDEANSVREPKKKAAPKAEPELEAAESEDASDDDETTPVETPQPKSRRRRS